MKLASLDDVYLHRLKDLASVERQRSGVLVRLAAAVSDEDLKRIFTEHEDETDPHLELVEGLYKALKGKTSTRHTCEGVAGIIEGAEPMLPATGDESAKDAALIGGVQRAEHDEVAGYGTAVALAEQLGRTEDAATLRQILEQEKDADRTLLALATGSVNPQAPPPPARVSAPATAPTRATISRGGSRGRGRRRCPAPCRVCRRARVRRAERAAVARRLARRSRRRRRVRRLRGPALQARVLGAGPGRPFSGWPAFPRRPGVSRSASTRACPRRVDGEALPDV